jgi:TIR domain
LKREGLLQEWHDRKIVPGQVWEEVLDENLETSDIVVLLVSSDFIASDYCCEKEMKRVLERHDQGESEVITVIVRPSDWQSTPFSKLQALPQDAKAITKWKNRDDAWLDVARGIPTAINRLRAKLPNSGLSQAEQSRLSPFAPKHEKLKEPSPSANPKAARERTSFRLDSDNDGERELLTLGRKEGEVFVVFEVVAGNYQQMEVEKVVPGFHARDIELVDVGNDGQQVVLCRTLYACNTGSLFYKYRDGVYSLLKKDPNDTSLLDGVPWFLNASTVDVDNDGQVEVVSEPKTVS